MPNLNPPVPGTDNPAAVVAAVVPITGSFVPRVRPVEAALVAVVAATVVANADNDPNTGVAEVLAAVGRPREKPVPVLAGVAAAPPNLRPPPRENPLVEVVGTAAPRPSPELGLEPAVLPPSVSPVEAEEGAPPSVNPGVGVAVAAAVVLFVPSVNPCDGVKPNVSPPC